MLPSWPRSEATRWRVGVDDRRVLLEGDRGHHLSPKLMALPRKLGNVLDHVQCQTELALERNRNRSAEIRIKRGRPDDERVRQRVRLDRPARHNPSE
jgi:hypothetical protein